jgi:two-component system chemotaxis response regulator CheB
MNPAAPARPPDYFLVAIGASTGGPQALACLLANAPVNFPPTVIVQHMPASFIPAFAAHLSRKSPLTVQPAREAEPIHPGCAAIAASDRHLVVARTVTGWRTFYAGQQRVNNHCPSIDVLFDSLTPFAPRVIAVLLTGMGSDGARGLLSLRRHGAITIAQDQDSCAVYGMPKAAAALNAVQYTAPPHEIAPLICSLLAGRLTCRAKPAP